MQKIFQASAQSIPATSRSALGAPTPTPTPTRHYLALDGLRGVAAIGVVTYHICGFFRLGVAPAHAYLAVDFFFMLSGFVIAHAYDRRLETGFGVLGFLAVRLVRLYPLVLLGLAIGTALFLMRAVSSHEMRAGSVLLAAATNALLLPSPALTYLRPWAFPTDTPLWSLAFELWVNILYAATFKFMPRAGLIAALAVGGVLVVWTSLAFGGLNVGYAWHDFYLGGARVLFPFLMGVLLARWLRGHAVRLPWAHVMFVPLILVLGAPAVLGGWYDVAAVLLVFPVILACAAQAGPQARLDPVWRWLGGVSYPVYVLHYPFVVTLSNLTKAHHLGGVAQVGVGMFTLVLVLGVSSLASRFYDIPVRRWLARRLSARAGGRDG